MKNLFFLILSVPAILCAQNATQSVRIKKLYKPQHIYSLSYNMDTKNIITFKGTEEQLAQIKESGLENPNVQRIDMAFRSEMITGAIDASNSFPVVLTYKTVPLIEGKKLFEPSTMVTGNCAINEAPVFRRVVTKGIDATVCKDILKTLNQIHEQVKYPDAPFRVGETQTVTTSYNFHISGIVVPMEVTSEYTLLRITDSRAHFYCGNVYTMKIDETGKTLTGKGSGDYTFTYDIDQNLVTGAVSDIEMQMQMNVSGVIMDMNIKALEGFTQESNPNK